MVPCKAATSHILCYKTSKEQIIFSGCFYYLWKQSKRNATQNIVQMQSIRRGLLCGDSHVCPSLLEEPPLNHLDRSCLTAITWTWHYLSPSQLICGCIIFARWPLHLSPSVEGAACSQIKTLLSKFTHFCMYNRFKYTLSTSTCRNFTMRVNEPFVQMWMGESVIETVATVIPLYR